MKKKLFTSALITSPIIALYGGVPFFIFGSLNFEQFIILTFGLTINVFLGWLVHIYVANRFPKQHSWWQFCTTYIINVAIRFLFFFIDPILNLPKPAIAQQHLIYPILTSFALNAIIMFFVNSIITQYQKAEAEKKLQTLKLENAEAQKQVLMQQLQPHFLFNTLSILKSLIGENQAKAEDYVIKLSDFLRYSVQANTKELITIEKELQFVQDYISLQKMRFGDSFSYAIDIPKPYWQHQIPVLSLQILIENIFKHNYFTERTPLHFSLRLIGNELVVENVKISIKLTDKSKTGLSNLNKRYQLILNKEIKIEETERSFIVKIPIEAP